MILYEYPLNERIRAYLRLEYLFDRLFFLVRGDDMREHQIAVSSLFDILEVCDRIDIKGSVLQDLERQRGVLAPLRGHPGVEQSTLESMLKEMERVSGVLISQGKTAQLLRDNEWLTSLRGRLTVAGGATQVEMPSFHAWQHKPCATRRADMMGWIEPLRPLWEGLVVALRILREAGDKNRATAEQGAYQQMLGGKAYQLLRVWVDGKHGVFPEISANKHMVWVRFASQKGESKPQPVSSSVVFDLSLCTV